MLLHGVFHFFVFSPILFPEVLPLLSFLPKTTQPVILDCLQKKFTDLEHRSLTDTGLNVI